jgi:hypothetical protein
MEPAMDDEIAELLRRKEDLDERSKQANNMVDYSRWIADVLAVLLTKVAASD